MFHACRNAARRQGRLCFVRLCISGTICKPDVSRSLFLTEDMVGPPFDADNIRLGEADGGTDAQGLRQGLGPEIGILPGTSPCVAIATREPRRAGHDRARIRRPGSIRGVGNGEQIRNWTHVSDIVSGTMLAAERIDDGTAVNLGTMERTRVIDAVHEVLRTTGHQATIEFHPRNADRTAQSGGR